MFDILPMKASSISLNSVYKIDIRSSFSIQGTKKKRSKKTVHRQKITEVTTFNLTFRYINDVLSINNLKFAN